MVYQINQKVITLDEYGPVEFRKELIRLGKENYIHDKKNKDWFNLLPRTFLNYDQWFFLYDDEEPVAFSTIQKYYDGCYRVLTRTYVYRKYRRAILPKNDRIVSPAVPMFAAQLEYIKSIGGYETIFVSQQGIGKINSILWWKKKVEEPFGLTWYLLDGMGQTCSNQNNKECFQNVLYSGKKPILNTISYEEYKSRWPSEH